MNWLDFGLYRSALSRRKQGFESPRERQRFQHLSAKMELGPAGISNFSPMDGASDNQFESGAVPPSRHEPRSHRGAPRGAN